MTKYLLTIILLLTHITLLTSQTCDLPNGDFEIWADVSEEFSEDLELEEPLPEGTIMLPEGYVSFFRILFSLVGDIFGVLGGDELEEFASTSLGISQVGDASNGDFAAKIGGDENGSIADLIAVSEYTGVIPSNFLIDVKHVGTGKDTLFVQGAFSNGSDLPFDESELEETGAYFIIEHASDSDTSYQTISVPIVNNNNAVSPDTLIMIILAIGDEEVLAEGTESYFIIDNMRFEKSTILSHELIQLEGKSLSAANQIRFNSSLNNTISSASLQRSLNTTGDFRDLVSIDLDTDSYYEDFDIAEDQLYYYRVVAHLSNGDMIYSEIISIKTGAGNSNYEVSIFPNPVSAASVIKLRLDTAIDNPVGVVLDITGKKIKEIQLPKKLEEGEHLIDLFAHEFKTGVYTFHLGGETFSATKTFVVE